MQYGRGAALHFFLRRQFVDDAQFNDAHMATPENRRLATYLATTALILLSCIQNTTRCRCCTGFQTLIKSHRCSPNLVLPLPIHDRFHSIWTHFIPPVPCTCQRPRLITSWQSQSASAAHKYYPYIDYCCFLYINESTFITSQSTMHISQALYYRTYIYTLLLFQYASVSFIISPLIRDDADYSGFTQAPDVSMIPRAAIRQPRHVMYRHTIKTIP